jgi:hypothetical protein
MSSARFCNASVSVPPQANSLYILIHLHTCFTYTKFLLNKMMLPVPTMNLNDKFQLILLVANNVTKYSHVITPCITVTT